jgi:hypothetical protein
MEKYEGKRFITSVQMRFMVALVKKACLLKLRLMILIRLIPHPKRVQIIL